METASRPTVSETRVPAITLLKMSMPSWSVPNQCSALGGLSALDISVSMGLYGVMYGPITAITTSARTKTRLTSAARLARRLRHISSHWFSGFSWNVSSWSYTGIWPSGSAMPIANVSSAFWLSLPLLGTSLTEDWFHSLMATAPSSTST